MDEFVIVKRSLAEGTSEVKWSTIPLLSSYKLQPVKYSIMYAEQFLRILTAE